MSRLIINDAMGASVELRPGSLRLGRNEGNDIQIEHPSISGSHCELRLENGTLFVKDIGSTNGTFVDHQPIQEATLLPGQSLQIGEVEVLFVAEEEAVAAPANPALEQAQAGSGETGSTDSRNCRNHADLPGKWICQKCHSLWCPSCARTQMIGMRPLVTCPVCSGFCHEASKHFEALELETATFGSLLKQSFAYPLRGNGLPLIIAGGVFFAMVDASQSRYFYRLGIATGGLLLAGVFGIGYLWAFLKGIVSDSANGRKRMPGWPEVTSVWDDVVVSFLQCLAVSLMCLGPATVAYVNNYPEVALALFFLGLFLLPMTLLAVALTDSFAGLNPLVTIPSIIRVFGSYLAACLVMLLVLVAKNVGGLLAGFIPIPILPYLISSCLSLYFLCVEMRILGSLYFVNRERLGWF